ncbi:MAG TPA: hypothetical protein VF997_18335, partial [Polyangia bacterium]
QRLRRWEIDFHVSFRHTVISHSGQKSSFHGGKECAAGSSATDVSVAHIARMVGAAARALAIRAAVWSARRAAHRARLPKMHSGHAQRLRVPAGRARAGILAARVERGALAARARLPAGDRRATDRRRRACAAPSSELKALSRRLHRYLCTDAGG